MSGKIPAHRRRELAAAGMALDPTAVPASPPVTAEPSPPVSSADGPSPEVTAAHAQVEAHRYTVHYPDHAPRASDPHYVDFRAYHRKHRAAAHCLYEATGGCAGDLELHHKIIEFALANAVDLALLERDYPGVSDPLSIGAWIETDVNFEWLCVFHHRGHGGAHVASASDFTAEQYIRGLIS